MENTNDLAKAVVYAYVALVNRLDTSVDRGALIATLSGFSELLIESGDSHEAARYLKVFSSALSGEPSAVQDALRTLH